MSILFPGAPGPPFALLLDDAGGGGGAVPPPVVLPEYVGWNVPLTRIEQAGVPVAGTFGLLDVPLPLGNDHAVRVGPVTALDLNTGLVTPVSGLSIVGAITADPDSDAPIAATLQVAARGIASTPGVYVIAWPQAALDAALAARVGQLVYRVVRCASEFRMVTPMRVTGTTQALG